MSGSHEYEEIEDVEVLQTTDKALLVKVPNQVAEWVPKSQVDEETSDIHVTGDVGTLVIKAWIARDRGWV